MNTLPSLADARLILASDWLQVQGAEDLWLQQRRLRLLSQERRAGLHLHRAQAAGARPRHVPLPQVTHCHVFRCHVHCVTCTVLRQDDGVRDLWSHGGPGTHQDLLSPQPGVSCYFTSLPALLSNTLRRSPARWRCPRCCAPPSTSQTAGSGGGTRAGPPGPSRAGRYAFKSYWSYGRCAFT